jgi:tetratricopeptide (TPR) repeat protein
MLYHSLRFPDLPEWRGEQNFSFLVRALLIAAYSSIQRTPHTLKDYAAAVSAIEPHLNDQMALRQRIRAFYVMGLAFAAVGNYPIALHWLDEALDLAYDLSDPSELLDLLFVHGNISRGMLRYRDAAMAYRDYLDIVEEYGGQSNPSETPLALDATIQLAGAEFFLAHYDVADQLLTQARDLMPPLALTAPDPELRLMAATAEWFQSQIYRWKGYPEQAILPATTAGNLYAELGSPISAARGQLMIAEIKLDIAERESGITRRSELALEAQLPIELALSLAAESGDRISRGLISLIDVRLSRLIGREQNRISIIEQVANMGQQVDDEALMAQAFTAWGAELAAQGDKGAALHRYREVRHILDGSDVPALGIWALRASRRIEENSY